jgi:hypothetical protein
MLDKFSDDSRLIVSEPLGNVPGVWNEVPESTYGVVGMGHDELHRFEPRPPRSSPPVSATGIPDAAAARG